MRALVMGGNRYIGLHLVRELARRGHDVTVMNSHEVALPEGVRRLHGDRQVPGAITGVLGPHRDDFDIVYDNTAYAVKDVEPMVELFAGRIEQFVFTSSVAVYRRSYIQPVTEDSRRHDPGDDDPRKAYGVGKVRTEDYLFGLHADTGFPASSVRITHTLGPMSPLVSRDPIFFERLAQGRPILVPGDGFPFVHMIHVADAASFLASMAGNPAVVGQAYNCGGTEITSIDGCIRMMAKAAGVEPHIVHVPLETARALRFPLVHWGEAMVGGAMFSVDKALRDLDWRPAFGIESGYRDSYDWWRDGGRQLYDYDFTNDDKALEVMRSG
jgi:nucleoside-diphosphate-sugar epimerase